MSKNKPVFLKGPVIKLNKTQPRIPCESNLLTNLGLLKQVIIYETSNTNEELIRGKYKKLTLLNYYNRLTNSSRTVGNAVTLEDLKVELTSDAVTRVIGQKNYDAVFHGICSIIDQQVRIKAMLSLLAPSNRTYKENTTQTDKFLPTNVKLLTDTESQTDVLTPIGLYKSKKATRTKRKVEPYVVRESVSIKPQPDECFVLKKPFKNEKYRRIVKDIRRNVVKEEKPLPVIENINTLLTDDSDTNMSDSGLSVCSTILNKAYEESLIKETDKLIMKFNEGLTSSLNTKFELKLYDGSIVNLPVKPEDLLHIATRDMLAVLNEDERKKVLVHQGYMDWKLCLVPNEDDNLPIHLAVLHNDVDLLTRQCITLQARKCHVDIVTGHNLSALHMAIIRESDIQCIKTLLHHKADPLERFEDERTAFHRAAESGGPVYMKTLLEHVQSYPRELLETSELWSSDMNNWTEKQMVDALYLYISEIADGEGYTPLMLACKLGRNEVVELLLSRCNSTVNNGMKTSGNTALYLAVEGAGLDAIERGNKSAIAQRYLQTIECLLVNCADPAIDNFSGSNVTTLLAEFNINALSLFMANKMTSLRQLPESATIDNFMIVKSVEKVPVVATNAKRSSEQVVLGSGKVVSGSGKVNILSNCKIVNGQAIEGVSKGKRKNAQVGVAEKKSKITLS